MNHIPDDELLSAYLDGELPADERLRVERLLVEQPESRQLLDELRALRGTLDAVPRYRLESDFAERVLRAAERTTNDALGRAAVSVRRACGVPSRRACAVPSRRACGES
jgi:anti-sigma factor RsiW